jgi:integrase
MLIVAQENQPAYLPLYQLAITTGMRQGELLGLTWDDLDWNKGTLKINRQLQRITGEGLCLTPPKTNAGRRTIKIGIVTLSMLKEHQKSQFKNMACRDPVWQDKNFIFAEANGAPIAPRKILKAFKRILAAAGLPDIRFHDLRHTAAAHMLANGVDLVTVSRRLGHTQASTTLNTYAHAVPGTQEKAAAIMDEITSLISLPANLTAPQFQLVAPGLHQERKSENSSP